MSIRVLLVDPDVPGLRAIEAALRHTNDIAVVGRASSGREAIEKASQLRPDVVLTEIRLPDVDGPETVAAIRARCPGVCVLVFTNEQDPRVAIRALGAGAVGYVLKDAGHALKDLDEEPLPRAIRYVADRKSTMNPLIARHVIDHLAHGDGAGATGPEVGLKRLSGREREVLAVLVTGISDREIARSLSVSENTIKTHLKTIYRKLGVRNRAQAAVFAALKQIILRQ